MSTRKTRALVAVAAALSVAAAFIHGWVAPEHAREWPGYAVFFVGLALAQAAFAIALLNRPTARLFAFGAAGNAAVVGLYALTRTLGVPFGPHAGEREAAGLLDLACTLAEAGTVAALVPLIKANAFRFPLRRIVPLAILAAAVFPAAAPAAPRPIATQRPQLQPAVTLPADDPKVIRPPVSVDLPDVGDVLPADEPAGEDSLAPCEPRLAANLPAIPSATKRGTASALVYVKKGNVYLYDVDADRVAMITAESEEPKDAENPCWSSDPKFIDDRQIVFISDYGRRLFRLDVATRTLTATAISGYTSAYAISPDHKWIAYLTDASDGTPSVRAARTDGTGARVIKSLDNVWGAGRCGSSDDEISVAWSPDGTKILLVATHLVAKIGEGATRPIFDVPTMYLISTSGEILATRKGTHARWSPDSSTIYFRGFTGVRAWYAMNVETAKDVRLPMTTGTNEIAVSPVGDLIAHAEAMGSEGKVYVYDVMTKDERVVAADHAAPVWLSPAQLAMSKLGPCPDCMDGYAADGSAAVPAMGGHIRTLQMASTVRADALYG